MPDLLAVAARDVCFAHWPVAPDHLRPHLPDPLDPMHVEGSAWLSVVTLEMVDVRTGPVSTLARPFTQVNFRTYVEHAETGDPGVYFLSLDCGDPLAGAVGSGAWGLPFRRADSSTVRRGDEVVVRSRRVGGRPEARFDARYRPTGESYHARQGTLADALIERHRFFVERGGTVTAGEIERDPWELYEAEATIHANTLAAAQGIDAPAEAVHVHYSPRFESTTGPVAPV